MKILGIETSCDESAAAIVTNDKKILSHTIYSQTTEHSAYGGVVPEISARAHIQKIDIIVKKTLFDANLEFHELDAIAATSGPGLIGGVVVGCVVAKTIAMLTKKPFIAIHHLEAHALTVRLFENIEFPYLMLLASGGHTMIVIVYNVGQYKIIGETLDDAIGEAFDKVAKMLQLGYPGGPIIESLAKNGDCKRFKFPTPLSDQDNLNFSLSGLKSAVKREIEKLNSLNQQDVNDICASFQETIVKIITNKLMRAIKLYNEDNKCLVIAGGVAANKFIAANITSFCAKNGFSLHVPPLKLCTDNGAMIAWAGIERFKLGYTTPLNFVPRSRWCLEDLANL
jgi:N6-L-threonylcarbamoyladenine synthase